MAPDEREAIQVLVDHFGSVQRYDAILEVGSMDVNGTVRDLFDMYDGYLGIDQRNDVRGLGANNVDVILSAHDMEQVFSDACFDWVLCNSVLEHDKKFWLSIREMRRVLKPGGVLIIGTPTLGYPHHGMDEQDPALATTPEDGDIFDYYRFTETTYRRFFFKGYEDFEILNVNRCGAARLCAAARKPK